MRVERDTPGGKLDPSQELIFVDQRAEEIRKNLRSQNERPLEEFDKQLPNRPAVGKTQKKRRTHDPYFAGQMHMELAHPGGYSGMWGLEPKDEKQKIEVFDPERKINQMYYRRRMSKIHLKDIRHVLSEFLKSVGYSEKEKRERLMRNMTEAIQKLENAGVWGLVTKGSWSAEELRIIHETLNEFVIDRDWDSSELVTIYPNEGSWWRDVFGSNPQEASFET